MKSLRLLFLVFGGLFLVGRFSAAGNPGLPPLKNTAGAPVIINARAFGFLPAATAAQNTLALQKISASINKADGGLVLVIDKGTYRVGKETMATKKARGYSYLGEPMLTLDSCTKPVVIEGNGAVLKLANDLHFGSFHSETGKAFSAPGGGFYEADYAAYPQSLIVLRGNKSVTVRNLVLDGNLQNLNLGGYWGDTGIQLPGDGLLCLDNDAVTIEKVTSQYFPRDGIMIGNTVPSEKTPVKKTLLLNCTFNGNARQGFSWIGGNHLYAQNCKFLNTGKTINRKTGRPVSSAPSAGIDMEAEMGLIRNGVFENCLIDNNAGAGFLTVGDVARIAYNGGKIVGATNWSIYGSGPYAVFQKTTIVGSPVNLRPGSGVYDSANTRFNNCLITLDSTLSPTGRVYGNYVMDFGGGAGGFFTRCVIDSKTRGTVYGGGGCVFTDCVFRQEPTANGYNGYPFMSGNFHGTNRWYRPGEAGMLPHLDKSKFYGPFYINDKEITGWKK